MKSKIVYIIGVVFICAIIALYPLHLNGMSTVSSLSQRLSYSFSHASLLHLGMNVFSITVLVRARILSLMDWMSAIGIAILIPNFALTTTPTIGASVVAFALIGTMAYRFQRQQWIAMGLSLAIGFLFPAVNSIAHLYAFTSASLISLLYKEWVPIVSKKF